MKKGIDKAEVECEAAKERYFRCCFVFLAVYFEKFCLDLRSVVSCEAAENQYTSVVDDAHQLTTLQDVVDGGSDDETCHGHNQETSQV